jgi:hypothetical protein
MRANKMKHLKPFGYTLMIMLTAAGLHVAHKFVDSDSAKKTSYNDMVLYVTVAYVSGLMANNKWS